MEKETFGKYRSLIRIAKSQYADSFAKQPNIVGHAFGKKAVNGKSTDEPALVVYVVKKVSKRYLPPSDIIPCKIYIGGDKINVDVVETGPIYALSFTGRDRPAPSGISVGHFNITAGTLGCLVTDLTDGKLCILSNNHVLADQNAGVAGDHILQPGVFDGGTDPADFIASLKRFQMLNPSGNVIDAAIAEVNNAADVIDQMKNTLMDVPTPKHPAVGLLFAGGCNRTFMNPIDNVLSTLVIEFLNGPGATVAAAIDMNVEKVGRTTEYTSSTIIEIDSSITVDYGGGVTRSFDHQFTTSWMSEGGDSGSIVCQGGEGGKKDKCNGGGCGSSSSAAKILQRDIRTDKALEKSFREQYLSQTLVGNYLIKTYFANEDYIVDRANSRKINKEDTQYTQHLYDKYVDLLRSIAINPDKNETRLNKEHLSEAKNALGRLSEHLHKDEKEAVSQLFELAQSFEGKTSSDILEMLNDKKIYNQVVKIVSNVKTLKHDDCK